jgi:hypothetical protein
MIPGPARAVTLGRSGGGTAMGPVTYEIRVVGTLGPAAKEAFADLAVETEAASTVLTGDLDQAALHGLIDRVQALGLELVDIRRTQGRPEPPERSG